MNVAITLKKLVDDPYFAVVCFIAICIVLPRYSAFGTMTACAALMSAVVAGNPSRFRSRGGSLAPALGFVVAMSIAAALLAARSLMGWFND